MSNGDLSARIRDLRAERSWSQEHLAGASGLSLRTVQRVESGYSCASDTLMALAAAFGIPAAELTKLAPPSTENRRVLGLTDQQAAWIGLALSTPSILFIAANFAAEWWGLGVAEWYSETATDNIVIGGPFLLFGPLLAVLLNLVQIVRFDVRHSGGALLVDRLQLRLSAAPVLVVITAGACLAVLGFYLALENLGHMVAAFVDR